MKVTLPLINPEKETQRISVFLKNTLKKTGKSKIVIGLSGGIDSATSLYLVSKVIHPKNIFTAHLYYFQPQIKHINQIYRHLKIPKQNQFLLSIKKLADELITVLPKMVHLDNGRGKDDTTQQFLSADLTSKIRLGNIMARIRMIILFDLAKKNNALVCGTENKSERLLGYFTRFGDAASDIEPITHLYKTQVYQLAQYLQVPEKIRRSKPSAGLWIGQTDEGEFGFSYQEADQVLFQYFDRKISQDKISLEFPNAEKIVKFAVNNSFKSETPYHL